jgi:acyl dehydratase
MLRALGGVALSALVRPHATGSAVVPGPWIEAELPPRPEALIRDYVEHVGGDPAWYRGRVPAHLFPQWGFPLLLCTLSGLPYPYARAVNAGCRIEQRGPLPAGEPLLVRARLATIDDDGRRALITQELFTGTRSSPQAMRAEMRVHVPLRRSQSKGGGKRPTVAGDARAITTLDVGARAGLEFALLTGDFNPLHWVRPYARLAGFRSTILHGFATLARAVEALNGALFAGDPLRLAAVDVRFTKPLVLPATVSVYTSAGDLWVGDPKRGSAYLEGRFDTTETTR